MLKNLAIASVCLAVLTACAPGMEITQQPVRVSPKNPEQAFGLDVFAAARQRGDPAPAYRGERLVTVRSELNDNRNGRVEFSGARCQIISTMFTAEITTPVQIIVPDYGRASPVITAECRAKDLRATESISVFNASQRARDRAYDPYFYGGYGRPYGYGGRGGGFGVGISVNLSSSANDTYEYPTLRVRMR